MRIEAVTIIGAGPAGLAAAIQLKRYGIDALLLEKQVVGGLIRNANLVENYPGFPGGIKGEDLARTFIDQAARAGVQATFEEVRRLDLIEGTFQLKTDKNIYHSRRVVIASGTKPRRFQDFEIPQELSQQIFYEVYPLLKMKKKVIVIVGAGDAAFDYALNLARNNHVLIFNRGEDVKCLPLLWERARAESRISYFENTAVQEISRTKKDEILLKYRTPAEESSIQVDYLVGAIGRYPQLDFFSEDIIKETERLDRDGFLYFIGDVRNDIYRQTSIAVGNGVLAAMKIYRREVEDAL